MNPEGGDPVEAFLSTLCRYLRDRGHIVFPMVEASGQERLLVALVGLYRRHDAEETGYLQFSHVVEALEGCGDACMERLREEAGLEGFRVLDGEEYAVFRVEQLRRLYRRCSRSQARRV